MFMMILFNWDNSQNVMSIKFTDVSNNDAVTRSRCNKQFKNLDDLL